MKATNVIYEIEIIQLKENINPSEYSQYNFKDLGYLVLYWAKPRSFWNFHGFITPEELKERIGAKQYIEFCNGKRQFIIQKRKNGSNIPIKKELK